MGHWEESSREKVRRQDLSKRHTHIHTQVLLIGISPLPSLFCVGIDVQAVSDFSKKHPEVLVGAVVLLVGVPTAFGKTLPPFSLLLLLALLLSYVDIHHCLGNQTL